MHRIICKYDNKQRVSKDLEEVIPYFRVVLQHSPEENYENFS
jgi:hypothetical protein